jgi:hypothetical protein
MRRPTAFYVILLVFLLFWIPSLVNAETSKKSGATRVAVVTRTERLGAAQGWTAYSYQEKSGKVCYLAGMPQKSEPAGFKRKRRVALVTHRPGEKVTNVVNFVEGYPLKEGSAVSLEIGDAKFELFTKGDGAWAPTSELDKAIVDAMAKGKQAVVKGLPERGPATTDTYSLAGFPQALALIDKACAVAR